MKRYILFIFLLCASFGWCQPKGYFMGFTYDTDTRIIPFVTILCDELPDLHLRSNSNGFFEMMLDTGTYHFDFVFGDTIKREGNFAMNEEIKIEANQATVESIEMENPHGLMRAMDLQAIWWDGPYFQSIGSHKKKLGLDYDSLCSKIDDHIEYEGKKYKILNAQMSQTSSSTLHLDMNLPGKNIASPFGCRTYCLIEFENRAGKRDYSRLLPRYALHNGELVLRHSFSRIPDVSGEEISVIMAVQPIGGKYGSAWKNPKEFLWFKQTITVSGMGPSRLLAYDMAIHKMVVDSLEKCPEADKAREERILKEDYGIPVFRPSSVYEWEKFSSIFCPMMDSLIEIKLGDGIFRDISRKVFMEDSLEKREQRSGYPKFPGGDSAMVDFFEEHILVDSSICFPRKNIYISFEIKVDSVGNVSYYSSEFRQLYQYSPDSWIDYDSLNCQALLDQIIAIIPKMPKWIPGMDGYEEPVTMITRFSFMHYFNGELNVNYIRVFEPGETYMTVCGNWRPPRKWKPHLHNRTSVW